MLFTCKIVIISAPPKYEIVSQISKIEFQILPSEGQYMLLKAEEGKPLTVQVEGILPIVDLPLGIAARHLVFLRVVALDHSPNFMNLKNSQG
jgi:hypothetical protein